MIERKDIEFKVGDGITLRGWLYLPDSGRGKKFPAISMAHGFASVKEHRLDVFARKFAEAGFVVMVHDHRNFGASDGTIRHDIDPWTQISDWRRAISFLETLEPVDPARIGIWGSSYSGGHVLVLGATDRRIKAVVSQVPTISGFEAGMRRVLPEGIAPLEAAFDEDERNTFAGEAPRMQLVVGSDRSQAASFRAKEAIDYYLQPLPEGVWQNMVTVRSGRLARMYEPGIWAPRVSPTPLMMIVATKDTITMTDLELDAFENARHPKKLVMVEGNHFDPYVKEFDRASGAAIDWFSQHLQDG
jgi:uncharacterized protein